MPDIFDISIYGWIALIVAGFFGGFLDSVAGGGGLITLPTALMIGLPEHIALGCNKSMGVVSSFTATLNFMRSGKIIWKVVLVGIAFTILGALTGANLVLYLDSSVVGKIILGLLPVAAVFSLIPRKPRPDGVVPEGTKLRILTPIVCFTIGVYDGFFGPGSGTILLLGMHLVVGLGFLSAVATIKPLTFASTITGLVLFIGHGQIYFPAAIAMAGSSILGSTIGSRMALKGGIDIVRKMLVLSILLLFGSLIYRYFCK